MIKQPQMISTPVLLILFNRPDTTLQVIRAIKAVKPLKLYIAADGPRPHIAGEHRLCQEAREAVLQEINWDCQVFTLFRKENAGCRLNVAEAISWFFEHEEQGIILEDDCLPNISFFSFCEELLELYKDDRRIMHISGFNDQNNIFRGEGSYFFSCFPSSWGWASWKRAWQYYSIEPPAYIEEKQQKEITEVCFLHDRKAAQRWFNRLIYHSKTTWDYQWAYCIFKHHGLCITSNIPLVENIGFDARATHTTIPDQTYKHIQTKTLEKIYHPETFLPDYEASKLTIKTRYHTPFCVRLRRKISHLASILLHL